PTTSPLFPYTTLFRSLVERLGDLEHRARHRVEDVRLQLRHLHRWPARDPGRALSSRPRRRGLRRPALPLHHAALARAHDPVRPRSEEHTSELQSLTNL